MHLVIRNDEELRAALDRAEELLGYVNGSAEERELEEIAAAVDLYAQVALSQRNAANDDAAS